MIREVKCLSCEHYTVTDSYLPTCKAFPNGIPKEIWGERVDHTKPYPEDNGIQFQQKED